MTQNKKITDYIKKIITLNVFYNKYLENSDYETKEMDKSFFLTYYEVRYNINLDNDLVIVGGKELIKNLYEEDEYTIRCHNFKFKNNSITVYSDLCDEIIYGYLIVEKGKILTVTISASR